MISQGYTIAMMIKVIFVFCLLYIIIPSRIASFDEEADKFLDKVFISLTHSTLLTIIIVHILAFLKLYDTFSLLFSYLVAYVLIIRRKGKSWFAVLEGLGLALLVQLFNISEGDTGFAGESRRRFYAWLKRLKKEAWGQVKTGFHDPFYGLFPVIVFIGAAFIRFRHSVSHATFAAPDSYVSLAWQKYLSLNQIYHDGVYPFGSHACLSALHKTFFIDPYWLSRFIGPFIGVMIFLSVYYFAVRMIENRAASLIAAVVFGLVTRPEFPSAISRQVSLIAQEHAVVFVLPGLYFFWLYLKSGKRRYLLLFAEALSVTVLIHPFSTVYLGLWSAIMMAVALVVLRIKIRNIFDYAGYSLAAVAAGLLPLAVGLLGGKDFHGSSASYVKAYVKAGSLKLDLMGYLQKMVTKNPFIDCALLLIIFLILYYVIFVKAKYKTVRIASIAFITFFTILHYRGLELNLPVLIDPYRTSMFLSMMLATVYSCGLDLLIRLFPLFSSAAAERAKNIFYKTAVTVLCLFVLYIYPPGKLQASTLEYEAAVLNYLVIKRDFKPLDWTIVAPAEQYQQALGIGWHYDLLRFVQRFTPEELESPDFKLPIPTHHVFVYVEKVPLYLGRKVMQADAEKELEPEGDNPYKQYYINAEQRGIIEAKAARLMEAYQRSHDNITVFYEDDNLKIYHIFHEPDLNGNG
ncbi:MAG: hypothetical protein QHH10_01550 [Peptococcaceae bacterium]|jgi:hypothetical protein|nr:hypothetical protein [Peptococcaceae bacterium]MDH7523980.1 hypothetical protein [Peptococcaceae bacterium]